MIQTAVQPRRICRCPRQHCGGWIEQRPLDGQERGTGLVCGLCNWEMEWDGDRLVPISSERHARAVEATTVRKRREAGT